MSDITPEQRKTIEVNLLAGLPPEQIAGALNLRVDRVLAEICSIVEVWKETRCPAGEINRRRLERAINRLWDEVDAGKIPAVKLLTEIVALFPEEERDDPAAALVKAELAEAEKPAPERRKAKAGELSDMAHKAGFAGVYWDLRSADPPLAPAQAFFCAWYQVYRGNREVLKLVPGLPTTILGMESFLGVSNTTLHQWKNRFGNSLGLNAWLDDKLGGLIPLAINQLERNIVHTNGSVSNTAIRTALDFFENRQGGKKGKRDAEQGSRGAGEQGGLFGEEPMPEGELNVLLRNLLTVQEMEEADD